MNKYIYLFRRPADEPYEAFRSFVERRVKKNLREETGCAWSLTRSTEKTPIVSLVPYKRERIVMISTRDEKDRWSARFEALPGFRGGCLVDEALPVDYERSWPDGKRTPGVGLLTLFHRNPRLSRESFLSEWYGRHTPMSLEIHPLWRYERNEVRERLTSSSPDFDGIVLEHFRDPHDLLNPVRLFGGWRRFLPNILRVGLHIRKFIDTSRMEIYLVHEWAHESGAGGRRTYT